MNAKRALLFHLLFAVCLHCPLFIYAENDIVQNKTRSNGPYARRNKYRTNKTTNENNSDIIQTDIALYKKNGDNEAGIPVEENAEIIERKVVIPEEIILPATATDDPNDTIEINFDGAELQNVLDWLSKTFAVQFITDDIIAPPPAGGKQVAGNKLTFKTQKPLTKRQVWDLCITFLDLFGLSIAPGTVPGFYKVVPTDYNSPRSVSRQPLPAYLNINWRELPNDDSRVRYTYFVRNSTLATLRDIVDSFKSVTGVLKPLPDLNAFILTDKSSNVRSIMQIVEELDATTQPEAMSVLKLKHADAEDVKTLYDNLTKTEDPRGLAARLLGTKKMPTTVYFPENLRVFAERRTNTLIILGPEEGIRKLEEFILEHVDTELKIPYSPLYVYELQYTKAEDIATILTAVTKFSPESAAAQSGGVRDGDKYLRPMTFQAEASGNRLLINAEKEDYLKVVEIIKQLDVKQPQVAVEVLIVNVTSIQNKELGIQIRNKNIGTVGKNVEFQTSGLAGSLATPVGGSVVLEPNGGLMGNLINLAQDQTPGSLLISLANSVNGVWALFKVLDSAAHTDIIANPYLVATNNYQAQVAVGAQRYVQSGIVQGAGPQVKTFDYVTANLSVQIKPLINDEGNINLTIALSIDSFTNAADPNDAARSTKTIHTIANIGNGEVLALGGLLQFNEDETVTKVPVLGDIPVLGWFFKNKRKGKTKDNLLVFISPRVVEPKYDGGMNAYSQDKADHAKNTMCQMRPSAVECRDPIHRWFFKDVPCENADYIDNFVALENPPSTEFYSPYPCYCPGERVYRPEPCARLETVDAADQVPNNKTKITTVAKANNKKTKSITAFLPDDKPGEATV